MDTHLTGFVCILNMKSQSGHCFVCILIKIKNVFNKWTHFLCILKLNTYAPDFDMEYISPLSSSCALLRVLVHEKIGATRSLLGSTDFLV